MLWEGHRADREVSWAIKRVPIILLKCMRTSSVLNSSCGRLSMWGSPLFVKESSLWPCRAPRLLGHVSFTQGEKGWDLGNKTLSQSKGPLTGGNAKWKYVCGVKASFSPLLLNCYILIRAFQQPKSSPLMWFPCNNIVKQYKMAITPLLKLEVSNLQCFSQEPQLGQMQSY